MPTQVVTQVITHARRVKQCKLASGALTTPAPVTHMAFGTGGVDVSGNPIAADELQTELHAEVARYPIAAVTYPSDTTALYKATIPADAHVGVGFSELALVDSAGDFVAIKNMTVKTKDAGTEMSFEIEDRF